ncbi:hypothetical protein CKO27_13565 [Thiocystis violacea]|nr:hypothetical protein [Thiocystis violacea]
MAHDFISMIALILLTSRVVAADLAADVEKVLREIRQDQPIPELAYLRPAEPVNADCGYFLGRYRAIEISVETHPNSPRVASILLRIPGPDQTQWILPAVTRVIGPPHSSDPKQSIHGWEWPKYRTASVHYAGQGATDAGFTIVSLFYR